MISRDLRGSVQFLPENITPLDASKFKFCLTISVEVKLWFSVYRTMLTTSVKSDQESFKEIIMHCFLYNMQH